MSHFEREAKINAAFLLAIFIVPLIVGFIVATWVFNSESYRVDRCLDAGGSYSYERGQCDHQTSHPAPE